MSTAWVECWKCDECGFRWIKTEVWPERCASSKCRKRSWNKQKDILDQAIERAPKGAIAVSLYAGEPLIESRSIQALRSMVSAIEEVGTIESPPLRLCPKIGFNELDGERYRCRLALGHKGNCAPGERLDN